MIVSCSEAISAEHHDLYKLRDVSSNFVAYSRMMGINIDGLFVNADTGFDAADFREYCLQKDMIANVPKNRRNKRDQDSNQYFDELLYRWRSIGEHPFAWLDSCKALLIRFETLHQTWRSINILG